MAINNVSEATKTAIRNKSAYSLPNNPTDRGYTPAQIKEAIYKPVIDASNSIITEIDRVIDETNEALSGVETSGRFITREVEIPANAWNNKTATVNVQGITATNIVFVSCAEASHQEWVKANIRCASQAEGSLTFKCDFDAPAVAVTANICYWG